jgi:antirestriction protein ArdC
LTFRSEEAFWHTFFHELGHFTGGHNRLRSYLFEQAPEQRKRSSPESGKEEAIAELVAMTMTHLFLRKNKEFRRTQQIGIRNILRFLNNIPKEERRDRLDQVVLEAEEACLFVIETMPLLKTLFV